MLRRSAARLYTLRLCDRKHKTLTKAGLLSDWPAQLHAAVDREDPGPVRRGLDGSAAFLVVRREVVVRKLAAALLRRGLFRRYLGRQCTPPQISS